MKTLQHGLMLTPWKEGWQTGQPDEVIVGREKGAPRLFFQLVPGKNAVCFRSIIADRRPYPSRFSLQFHETIKIQSLMKIGQCRGEMAIFLAYWVSIRLPGVSQRVLFPSKQGFRRK